MKGIQQETLSKYSYNKDKPIFSSSNYFVYNGTNKESNLPVTIKTLKYPHVQLSSYLKKMKQCKSQNVIKIYELVSQQQFLIMVTQQVVYGNLKKNMEKCKYIDETDAIFLSKQMLNGHVDLLRFDLNWFGTEEDIQFIQDGQLKLSWNNGCSFNLVNPFPVLVSRICSRSSDPAAANSILPFPQSKMMTDLINLSKQNASQISMNPLMKKKQKLAKKKGKDWIGLKQYKNKNQYFDEFGYFAIHASYGFVRTKVYDQGKISPNLLQLNKTKTSFAKVYDVYDQGNKTIIISEYSNDGNLQSYVARLKTAGVTLKQDQIQFFVYSLLDPIKAVQESSLKAICMLHIRNIFIQSGIPKIGQPVPLNQKINQVLIDRSDVPDFYHPDFKRQPTLRQSKFDTYSLGVLLYKLMYTQLPIFPNGKVHIPTAPTYNKRLKQSVQIFLNEGGTIRQIQQRIEMSDQVKKRVEQNKQKLKQQKDDLKLQIKDIKDGQNQSEQQQQQEVQQQSSSDDGNGQPKPEEQSDQEDDGPSLCERFSKTIALKQPKKIQDQKRRSFVDQLQLSTFKGFRIWSKCIIICILYLFLFYYRYIQNSVMLLASQGLLTKIDLNVNPNNASVSIITTDRYQFEKIFNKTGKTLPQLKNMNCLVQDSFSKVQYSQHIKEDSPNWLGYVFGGLSSVLLIMVLKVIQIHTFDDINAWFRKQEGQGHFNILNWIMLNLHWLCLISGHYFLFNFAFNPQTQPCIGHKKGNVWGSTDAFFNQSGFIAPYAVIFGLQALFFVCYLIMINKNIEMTPKYNKLVNTLTIFGTILLIFWFIIRFGAILMSYYYPAAFNDSTQIIPKQWNRNDYIMFFGILPEFLFIIQFACIVGINVIYYVFVDKNQKLLNSDAQLDASLSGII